MGRWLLLGAVLCACLAGCPRCQDTARLDVTLHKAEDTWFLRSSCAGTVVLITSPSGIGAATIRPRNAWPDPPLLIGLRYKSGEPFTRLEGFHARASSGEEWRDLASAAGSEGLLVELPAEALGKDITHLEIDWVDMYRH